MTTRAIILRKAFGRIGITDYEFNVSPDERADARSTLDGMMEEWFGTGIDLGYIESADDDNDGVLMTTPMWADAAIWNNLAIRLAPEYGKSSLADVRRDAKRGYDLVMSNTLVIPREQRCSKVRGARDRFYRRFVC